MDTEISPTPRFAPVGVVDDPGAGVPGGGLRRSARDWLADGCCAGVAALLDGLFILGMLTETPPDPVYPVWELGFGGAALVALLLLRRRWPVGLALALVPAALMSAVALGAALMAVFSVAVRRPWRVTVAVGGLLPSRSPAPSRSPPAHRTGTGRRWRPWCSWRPRCSPPACWSGRSASSCVRSRSVPARPRRASSSASRRHGVWSGNGSPGRCTTCSPTGSGC
jgi:hypothetical protein